LHADANIKLEQLHRNMTEAIHHFPTPAVGFVILQQLPKGTQAIENVCTNPVFIVIVETPMIAPVTQPRRKVIEFISFFMMSNRHSPNYVKYARKDDAKIEQKLKRR